MHGNNPSDIAARMAVSPSRYIGKVCGKHPELGGLRRRVGYVCVQCARDKKAKWKQQPQVVKRKQTEEKNQREMAKVGRIIEQQAVETVRLRAATIASARVQNVSRWPEFVEEARSQIEAETK